MSLSFELSRPRKGLWAEGGWGGKDGLMVVEMGGEEERDRTDYYLALHRLYGHSMVSFESPPFPLRAQLVRSCSSFQTTRADSISVCFSSPSRREELSF